MKGFTTLLIAIVVAFALALGSLYYWFSSNTKAVSTSEDYRIFVVPRGSSAEEVGNLLYKSGLIKSPLAFKFYVQIFSKSDSINAGEFKISPSMSVSEIVGALGGGALELWVTIPEGFRREEIADRFIESLGVPSERQNIFRKEFLSFSQGKEGYLFPDTYLFPPEASASAVVGKLNSTFYNKISGEIEELINKSNYNLNQIITLASIIEREAIADEERPVIAGILWNRYELGMALQADATAQYANGTVRCSDQINCAWWEVPLLADLEIDSPYNTYKHAGLPPAPIANPGIASIKAAADPQDTDYLYYIHDKNGQIYYAETLEGHNRNVQRFLR